MKTNSFFEIYDLALKRKRWNCTKLSDELRERGFDISPRSLQRYRTKEMKPNTYTAKEILKALEIKMTDDELVKSLEIARSEKIKNANESNCIERGVRIPYAKCSDTMTDIDKIKAAIDKRLVETQGRKNPNFNKYLTDLIRYDLDNNILPDYTKGDKE